MYSESSFTKNSYRFLKEKRNFKRKPLEITIPSFRLNNLLIQQEILTKNICKYGLGFTSMSILPIDGIMELFLPLPNTISIPITTKIIWKGFLDDTNIYGAEIIALPENFKGFLFNYIDEL